MTHKIEALKMLIALMAQGYSREDAIAQLRAAMMLGESELIQVVDAHVAMLIADIKRRAECPLAAGRAFLIPQAE